MKKEKECCCGEEELYGGAPSVFCDAVKSIKNRREFIKKALKPAEDKAKELVKATASDAVRLHGTKETKAPKLRPYVESIHIKDRKDLGPLIESAKRDHRPWKVERSKKEGFRYIFTTKILKEEKLPKGVTLKKDAGNVPLNVAHFNHAMGSGESAGGNGGEGACCGEGLEDEKEPELDLEVAPIEDVMPKDDEVKEEKPELTMAEVFTKYFDMHGNEDHSITICLKGCIGKEDCPCITTEPLSDEEFELLKGEFHEEEPEEDIESEGEMEFVTIDDENISEIEEPEEVIEESKEDDDKFPNPEKNKLVDTYKGVDIYDCTCGKFVAMINGEKVKKETIDELKKCIDGKCESLTEDFKVVDSDGKFKMFKSKKEAEEFAKKLDSKAFFLDDESNTIMVSVPLTEDEHKEETTIEADKVETTKCEDGECKEKTEIFTELPDFDVEVEQKGDKVEVEIIPKEKSEEEIIIEPEELGEGVESKDYLDTIVSRAVSRVKKESILKEEDDAEDVADINKEVEVIEPDMEVVQEKEEPEAIVDENVEIRLDDLQYFKPVAGARETWKVIIDSNKVKELSEILGDFAKDGKMTTTDLNDILWFEKNWIFDKLGIKPGIKSGEDVIEVEAEVKEDK